MSRQIPTFIWYLVLATGAWRVFALDRRARRHKDVRDRARAAALTFGAAGVVIWAVYVLDEARQMFGLSNGWPGVMGLLGIVGAAAIFGILVMVPMWLPRVLLSGRPGPASCTVAWAIARFAGVFGIACIVIAPIMMLFARSMGELMQSWFSVAIPLGLLVIVSNRLATAAKLVEAQA